MGQRLSKTWTTFVFEDYIEQGKTSHIVSLVLFILTLLNISICISYEKCLKTFCILVLSSKKSIFEGKKVAVAQEFYHILGETSSESDFVKVNIDLHSHSGYAGGTMARPMDPQGRQETKPIVKKRLLDIENTMPLKGIQVVGTGDVQFKEWNEVLRETLEETTSGIWGYKEVPKSQTKFLLQTEIIITCKIGKKSKLSHTLFLFPDFKTIEGFNELLTKWEVSTEKMARPFLVCKDPEDVGKKINEILDLDPLVEAIPAHIMTPEGVFGSKGSQVNSLGEFYAQSVDRIQAVETGLSADPIILGLIPELDNKTLLSNSDAHSAALHRMGREFTSLKLNQLTYKEIIMAIRGKKVIRTAEFHPQEGRYFLTGHRGGKRPPKNSKKRAYHVGEEFCVFSPKHVPKDKICPICHKTLTVGVLQRAFELCEAQGEDRNLDSVSPNTDFVSMVPLVEVIAYSLGIKSPQSKRVIGLYKDIVNLTGTECDLWFLSSSQIQSTTQELIPEEVVNTIISIKEGQFCFRPSGFDGVYGTLVVGEKDDYLDVNIIKNQSKQKTLSLTDFT